MKVRVFAPVLLIVLVLSSLVVEKEISYRVPLGASPLNSGPEGTSGLVNVLENLGYEVRVVTSWTRSLLELSPCLVMIVSPEVPYTEEEVEIIKTLVSRGTSIIVADEGTLSNKVLESLDMPVKITGLPVSFNGSSVFPVKMELDSWELRVIYAYASSLQILPEYGGSLNILASMGGDVMAVLYEEMNLRAAVISDGTVVTNALLNPANPLNHNYVFVSSLIRIMCPEGVVLIEGSKYRLRPLPATSPDSPIITYLDPLARVLGLAILLLASTYLFVSSRTLEIRTRKRPLEPRQYGSYDVAIRLCSTELAEVLGCGDMRKVGDFVEVLKRATQLSRSDRDIALKILRRLLEVRE